MAVQADPAISTETISTGASTDDHGDGCVCGGKFSAQICKAKRVPPPPLPSSDNRKQNAPKIAPIFATAATKRKVVDLEPEDTSSKSVAVDDSSKRSSVAVDESSKRSKKQVAALQESMQGDLQQEKASGANIVPDRPDLPLCKCQLAPIDPKKATYADLVMHKEKKLCPEPDWQLQFSAPPYN